MTAKGKRLLVRKIVLRIFLGVLGVLALITVVGVLAVSSALAQTPTPVPQAETAAPWGRGWGHGCGFGFAGGSTAAFDAVAKSLNLTPTQLFEQLHSGKSLSDIAQAEGVDLQKVQDAANAVQTQAMKDAIAQAVRDEKMSQAQADWLLQGLEQGFLPGRGGFGHGMRRGGMRGFGAWRAPSTVTPQGQGTQS